MIERLPVGKYTLREESAPYLSLIHIYRYEDAKKFVRYSDGAKMYSMGMTKFQEVAKDCLLYTSRCV